MKISEITIACFDLDGMVSFYQNVFSLSFNIVKIPQGAVFVGDMDEVKLTLCPADLAGIKAKDNRHQISILVDNIDSILRMTQNYHGSIMQDNVKTNGGQRASIRDVDGNSIVLIQEIK